MKRIKSLISAILALLACACLYCPIFHAMPKFMDRYDADPMAKAELKGKCSVCHIEEDGYGPLNAFGKAFAENGYRITDGLRGQAPDLFASGQGATKPPVPAFDVKTYYDKNCAVCHGADGKGGEETMIAPNFKDAAWQKRRTDQSLFDSIAKGKGMMPAWKEKMTEEQISAMITFIRRFPEMKAPSTVMEVSPVNRVSASPDIAVGPDGSVNVIWVDKGEAKHAADAQSAPLQPAGPQSAGHSHKAYNNLYFARSTDGGRAFSRPLRINAKDGELWGFATSRPRIAVGKSGVIHIFYHANRRDPSALRQAVDARYSRSTDGGKTFSTPTTLNSASGGLDDGELDEAHCFGGMGVAPNGDVHTFWIDTRHMTSPQDNGSIYTAISRNEGKTFEPERTLFRNTVCPCCQLNVTFSPKGVVILSSRNVTADGARDASIAVSKDGGMTYSAFVATTPNKWMINACPLKPATLGVDKDGRIFAAWFSGAEKPAGSFFAVSEDGGKSFSKPITLHPEAVTPDRPQIAVSGDGAVTVVWDAMISQVRRIYLRVSPDHGKTFGPIVELDAPEGTASHPAIAAAREGKVVLVWQQNNRVMSKAL